MSGYFYALISILMGAFAQLCLKKGVMEVSLGDEAVSKVRMLLKCVSNWYLMGGFVLYGLSALVWLVVLSKFELSKAYPMVSLGYVLTLLLGYYFLGEAITLTKVIGILLICVGVVVISR